jgi:hypothetical protein
MTKCSHYSPTFIITVQTARSVIQKIEHRATDIILWAGASEDDFHDFIKEMQYNYDESGPSLFFDDRRISQDLN